MVNELHAHNFIGKTSFNVEHSHNYSGTTNDAADQIGHIHYMEGVTTSNDGHTHSYRLPTGPAIYVKGGHYHYYKGNSEIAMIPTTHSHTLNGYTSIYMG